MANPEKSSFLRRVLWSDAAISGAAGLLMALGAEPLAAALLVPVHILRYAGVICVAFAALLLALARSASMPREAVLAVIVGNVGWVLASIAVLFVDGVRPNPLGYAFVLGQAAAVAVLAELQTLGWRRAF
jgi:hypothetical protein